jgi:hypothetical protein
MTPVQDANADRAVEPARISIADITSDCWRDVSTWGRAKHYPEEVLTATLR